FVGRRIRPHRLVSAEAPPLIREMAAAPRLRRTSRPTASSSLWWILRCLLAERVCAVRCRTGVVSRAELALRTVTATIPEIERQIGLKENEINTLLGRNPGPVTRTSTLLAQDMPVEIPVGLPSSLLERRPDVRAAEQQVRVANAEIGVAIGDFFPRIGLTTFYGGTSTDL